METLSPPSYSLPTPSLTLARSLNQNVDELDSMSPFELFKSQLDTGRTEGKVDALKRVKVVALAMGAQDVLDVLIPYLTQNIALKQPPHEDEVLLLLAQQLELLVPSLLHTDAACVALLPMLERLMSMEETVVRDAAVHCTNHIVPYITATQSTKEVVHLVKRLVGADWFAARVSAAGVVPKAIEMDAESRWLVRDLSTDDTPMVRRAAATTLGQSVKTLYQEHGKSLDLVQDLIPYLQGLCKDEQDSVRLLAVASMKDMDGFQEHPDWTASTLLPLLKAGSTDASWRVRHKLAKCFSQVVENIGPNVTLPDKKLIMACFVSLLQDLEPEVRAAAVTHFAKVVLYGGEGLFQAYLLALLPALADDVVMEVRSKTALALMDASCGGALQDATILSSFGPLLETFLQDEYPEVQLHVLQNLSKISHLLHQMSGVVTSILHMSKASNWRVRQGVAQLLPHLFEARGVEFFQSVLLEPAWLALLQDSVACVRQACVDGVVKLATVARSEWMLQQLVPHHVRLFQQSNYLLRMTMLQTFVQMCLSKQDELVEEAMLHVLEGLEDKVANVRMSAAKGLLVLLTNDGGGTLEGVDRIKAKLESALEKEEDADARHFVEMALKAC